MGMYSYVCKGCGQELIEDELVRLNGCTGGYDGYGRAGGFSSEGNSCVAWHERCYQQASAAQKHDRKPSKNARNQGFGPRHLEFLEGYDPKAKTVYYAQIGFIPSNAKDEDRIRSTDLILTDRGWVDAKIWEDKMCYGEDEVVKLPEGFEDIGDPYMIRKAFPTLDGAKAAAEEKVQQWAESPFFSKEYDLYVMARQELPEDSEHHRPCLYGMAYHLDRSEKLELKDNDWVHTGIFEERIYWIGQRISLSPGDIDKFLLEQIAEISLQLQGIAEEFTRMESIIKSRISQKKD